METVINKEGKYKEEEILSQKGFAKYTPRQKEIWAIQVNMNDLDFLRWIEKEYFKSFIVYKTENGYGLYCYDINQSVYDKDYIILDINKKWRILSEKEFENNFIMNSTKII